MQIKGVKTLVKDVKRRFSGKHKRKSSASTTTTTGTSDSSPPAHNSPLRDDPFARHTVALPLSPRSRSSSATLNSHQSSDVIDISSKHSGDRSESHDMISASENSGTFVTAEWGPASPRVHTISIGRNSSVAPASITSSHPSQSSLYSSAQSMALPPSQEESPSPIDRPSQLQPLPEDSGEGPESLSPPPQVMEPEVPDPFKIEDSEGSFESEGEGTSPADEEIALAQSAVLSPEAPPSLPSPNVNKDVPPPPASETESDAPELYLPGLVMPPMFLPIPNVRLSLSYTLTWWFHQRPPLMYYPCTIRRTL